jgi:hypothetical protein
VALAKLHHLIEKHRPRRKQGAVLFKEPNVRRTQKMQLLFYLPLIIWMGLFEVAQSEMRVCAIAVLKAFGSNVEAL